MVYTNDNMPLLAWSKVRALMRRIGKFWLSLRCRMAFDISTVITELISSRNRLKN